MASSVWLSSSKAPRACACLPVSASARACLVSADENGLTVDLHVVLENGVNMKSVCHNLSSSVAFTLQEIAQIDPASLKIGIHIDALKSRLN